MPSEAGCSLHCSVPAVTAACLLEWGDGCDGRVLAAVGCPAFWDVTAIQIFSFAGLTYASWLLFSTDAVGESAWRMVGIVMNIKG